MKREAILALAVAAGSLSLFTACEGDLSAPKAPRRANMLTPFQWYVHVPPASFILLPSFPLTPLPRPNIFAALGQIVGFGVTAPLYCFLVRKNPLLTHT